MLCFVSAMMFGAGCARAADLKYERYDDPKGRFHMDHPQEWKLHAPVNPQMIVAFANKQPGFAENVNVVSTQLPTEMSEEDLDKVLRQVLPRRIADFRLISDGPEEVSGHHVHRMIYTATAQNRKLEFTQVGFVVGKANYVITFTTFPERQKQLEPIINHVLETFKLEEKEK